MSIDIRNITKRFGNFTALDDVSLDIAAGELVALLGPSGCGKTTLLRIIAGLENADGGAILFSGEDITHVHVRDRQVGFVFQHYALFRHMSVADNIAFGLRIRPRGKRPPEAQVKAKVQELLRLVQLEHLAERFPSQLSGGQRQRVALARALAVEPKVLLLDEPFGALDAKVRKELRRWLRSLHDELHVTSIFVTHDQEEALEVADRVVVMNAGRIEQVGTPQEVWEHPATPFVYGFLGEVNTFREKGSLAFVRPHELDVQRHEPGKGTPQGFVARLTRALVIGPLARLELSPSGDHQPMPGSTAPIEAHIPAQQFRDAGYREGETLVVTPRNARVFEEEGAA
jgi:sulfate transport system ATP-binding protein